MSVGVMLFNPFTGKPRHPSDIASDPKGILIWDGEEPLKAHKPPASKPWVGLTEDERTVLWANSPSTDAAIYATEAKLKEKNV